MSSKNKIRRSGAAIMAGLIILLGKLSFIMLGAVINGCLGFVCSMSVTIFGAVGIAKVIGENISLSYEAIMFIIVLSGLLRGLLRYIEQYSNHYIAFRLLAVLRDKIFGALCMLCPAKLENKQKGSIIAMITSDIETLEVFYAHTISPVCIAFVMSVAVCIFTGVVASWWISLIAFAGYAVIGIIVPLISSKALKESGVNYRNEFASFNAYFLDSIKGIKDIIYNNAGKSRALEVNERSDRLLRETKKMKDETTLAGAVTELLVTVFIFATLITGIVLVRGELLSMGRMIIGVVTVFGSFGPVIAVASLPGNLTQTFASGERVLNLLAEKPVVSDINDGKDFEFERLDVRAASFGYDDEKEVLENVSLSASKGEIVGIVGESGSGKSTLLKLLLRFWSKDSGEILYNGMDIEQINTKSLRDNVTMVSQSTYLFDMTIADNLKIANPDATEEEMYEACKMASIHDFIMSLPDKYQTRVGGAKDNLSAGEKQRIGLARAFLSGCELILLDEPTSNVDSINEGIILKALTNQKKKKSIILVSHRESTMSIADRVYNLCI